MRLILMNQQIFLILCTFISFYYNCLQSITTNILQGNNKTRIMMIIFLN